MQHGLFFTVREIVLCFFINIGESLCFCSERSALKALKKLYRKNAHNSERYAEYFIPKIKKSAPCIWTCWMQGDVAMPPIVTACISTMHEFSGGLDVIIITAENIDNYVTMPPYIMQKYKSGKISVSHFTDILRAMILVGYGGVWIDAAVLLTSRIPPFILESDFFIFQDSLLDKHYTVGSNWFIAAHKDNVILKKTGVLLFKYWAKRTFALHAQLFNITLYMLHVYDDEVKKYFKSMPYFNNSAPHLLQKKLFDIFDFNTWNFIKGISFAHKLTFKFKSLMRYEKMHTIYQFIIEENTRVVSVLK
jgi:hypothetical protein